MLQLMKNNSIVRNLTTALTKNPNRFCSYSAVFSNAIKCGPYIEFFGERHLHQKNVQPMHSVEHTNNNAFL